MIYRVRLKEEWNNEAALSSSGIDYRQDRYIDKWFNVTFDKERSTKYLCNCYIETNHGMLFHEDQLIFLDRNDDAELDDATDKALEKAGEKILADMGDWDKVFGIAETKDPQRLNDVFDEEMVKIELGLMFSDTLSNF